MTDETVQVGASTLLAGLLPLHFPIHDSDGNCIVIEFTDGKAMVYNNPVSVLTNQPEFPWHLENLRNYTSLSPYDANEATFNGYAVTQTGHGSGLSGLPGDPPPPSRFVRATVMTSFAAPVTTLDAGTHLAFHIVNTVDIPKGLVACNQANKSILPDIDYTQWVAVRDAAREIYSVRFYQSQQVRPINLTELKQSGPLDELNGMIVPFASNGFGNMTSEELGATEIPKSVADLPRNN